VAILPHLLENADDPAHAPDPWGIRCALGSGPPLPLGTRKAHALLAYLAVPPGRTHSRDKLAALLWGNSGHEQARQMDMQFWLEQAKRVDLAT